MKKLGFGIVATISLLLITGCGNTNTYKQMECTLSNSDPANNYSIKATYDVEYENDIVKKVTTIEEVTSNDSAKLEQLKNTVSQSYEAMNTTYKGYTYNIDIEGNKLTSKVIIDYSKMDLNKFASDQPDMKTYLNDKNELTLKGIKSMYESQGATCKNK